MNEINALTEIQGCQICQPKVDYIGAKWDKTGTFSDKIELILDHRAKFT